MVWKWLYGKVTAPLPQSEYERVKKHPEIKWGAVARVAILKFLDAYEKMVEDNPGWAEVEFSKKLTRKVPNTHGPAPEADG